MTLTVLFGGRPAQREIWKRHLEEAAERRGVRFELAMDPAEVEPASVDVLICNPEGPIADFSPYVNLKAALNMWAGVETIVGNETLKAPLARMVEHGLTEGMTDYVVAHVMRHHLGIDRHILMEKGDWPQTVPPLARSRNVGILGLGELGSDAARALSGLRFRVHGWSRSLKDIPGVTCRAGEDGLAETLRLSEILVLLLPSTPGTERIMDAERLSLLPEGAVLVNPGRGSLIDDDALIAALDSGRLSHATLDTFRAEPLPLDHPFWDHPKVTITPHIASATRPETAADALVEQIGRVARGEPILHVVDRARGY